MLKPLVQTRLNVAVVLALVLVSARVVERVPVVARALVLLLRMPLILRTRLARSMLVVMLVVRVRPVDTMPGLVMAMSVSLA